MNAAAPDVAVADRAAAGAPVEVRCPSCARVLVLRSGPAVRPHFAHRPRQSCRARPGSAPVRPLRLEQLTLFDLEAEAIPTFYWEPLPDEVVPAPPEGRARRRRRRRAWLPRLVRWVRARRPPD